MGFQRNPRQHFHARKIITTAALIFWTASLTTTTAANPVADAGLQHLDSIITLRQHFEAPRRKAIDQAKNALTLADDDGARYDALRALYENYRSYRIDSALIVASQRLDIARRMADPSKTASATLNTAEAYARSGSFDRAIYMLDTLDRNSLRDYHLKYVDNIYRSALEMKAATALLPADRLSSLERNRELRRKALSNSNAESRGRYTLQAEELCEAGLFDEAVNVMEDAEARFDFTDDAAMLYKLGEIYLAAGRRQQAVESLTRSAIIDISTGTKEYKSLILLASILFEEGQTERAFRYINCAFEDAEFSKANLHTPEIMKSLPVIDRAYREAREETAARTRTFLILSVVLSVLLLVSLVMVIIGFRMKRRMIKVIEDINSRLEQKNNLLVEADRLKLRNINILMMAYAKHITHMRDFRKKVYRLFKTRQYDKAMDAVKWDKAEARDTAAFHEMFDEAFMSMFPDFVDEVNKWLKEPVALKDSGRFTPELRVIAMMKLGMTSTDEIAEMFHYSPQTVYNLRTSIRGMLAVPWSDFEKNIRLGNH